VERVRRALGALACAVHHVGATSVPDLPAFPVLDLLAEVESLDRLVQKRLRFLAHGFEELTDPQPEDCRLYVVDDLLTGERRVELRCYTAGHREAERIPALFALLRARPDLARAYHEAKLAAWAAYAADEAAYQACKRAWLERVVDEALASWRAERRRA
jgi:GrpB-like predicted nucleotidyltransferase (UPF0157 family)